MIISIMNYKGGIDMRAGHIIYKVNDLEYSVQEWKRKGFEVEYGTPENPYNALIYFSEGPYI